MRSVRVNTDVPATKGSAELNHHNNREHLKEVRDGGGFNGQGLSEEDESRIHEDANGRRIELVQAPEVLQRQQPQPQGPVVQWERFLPLRSLKVLLVENDDSTRHVVSALLRNCSYEVTAVENGLEAWKVLVDLNKQIDLVLTEVVMPYLSGVGLLSKITSHVVRKNIPVIMMSTDDSMGIVFNCLSKGAVDFLVKPIRKNELKNLWQHVWRKCHSSSGSGSESGIRTRKSTKSRSIEGSDDDTGSSDDDNRSIGLTTRDGSDNGSGTQNSWSKRAVELDSSQAISSWDQLKDLPDSTCAQVIHARPESFDNCWGQMTTARECGGKHDKLDAVAMGKDLEIGFPSNPDLELEDPSKKVMHSVAHKNKEKLPDTNPKKVGQKLETRRLNLNCEMENAEARTEAARLTDIVTARSETVAKEVSDDLPKSGTIKDKAAYHQKDSPVLELSLKRPRDEAEDLETSNQERNVLRHSGLSAFSRYNTTMSNANQAPTGIVGSCSPVDISSEAGKPELQSNSNGTPNQRSNGSNDDMGSTTNNVFTKLEVLSEKKPTPRSASNIHSTAFQSIHLDHSSSLQPANPSTVDDTTVHSALAKPRGTHQQVHHHHHYHHHHHRVHNMQQQKQIANPDDPSLRNMASNVLTASAEGNAANYGSASGSNNKSNGENGSSGKKGSSSAAATEGGKTENDNGITGKCEAGDGSGSGSGTGRVSGVDQNRLAQREAALNKFRQKRKERCFEKKVRYQSRKRLAEQRPRVRGQFVRQGVSSNKNEDEES